MLMPKDFYHKLRRRSSFIKPYSHFIQHEKPKRKHQIKFDSASPYPPHFDWREKGVVTPVKSQFNCGSCWAFAAIGTVETSYAIAHGELRNLSEQELLDCDLANNACNGGDDDKAFRFIHEHGLMREEDYPYVAQRQNSCLLNEYSGPTTKLDLAYFIASDENAMLEWLVNFGPINVGINVPPDMKLYKGGVYTPSPWDCKNNILGTHALNIMGYGTWEDGQKYWIVKNSWGPKYGIEDGYVYMARGENSCGIEDEPIGILC
uniref:Cathepsin L-like cysteine proteinase n=1 Tax=Bursaphelenchus xylophilus TaxID=6326 RepID=B8QQJ2_BURXY|nr:cathepsin L-like cysteine proteinase [Bursaphelenchus xylophilus]